MPTSNRLQEISFKPAYLFPFLIIILPILGYWLYCNYLKPISPYYQDYDPEFQYFLNSLAAIRGGSYTYIDHPGTPLEVIGSVILLATRPFLANNQGGFAMYHLEHPELFLGLARGLIILMSIGCALLFFHTAKSSGRLEDVLIAASLSMMFFIVHPDSFPTLMLWSHNSFNFALGTFLLILLYRTTKRNGEVKAWKIIGLGLGMGILTAVAIYFIAWIAGALITLVVFYRLQSLSWRKTTATAIILVGSSIAGFLISTLPILNLYPQFMDWLKGLIFHEGIYGGGAEGITTPALMLSNFMTLFHDLPILSITLGIELFLLLLGYLKLGKTPPERAGLGALATGLVFQLLLEIVMIVKHPKDIYMLAIAAILPVLMTLILEMFQSDTLLSRILRNTLTAALLIGLIFSLYTSLINRRNYTDYVSRVVSQTSDAILQYGALTGRTTDLLYIYWTYGTYSPCQSLQYGDNGTSSEVTDDIKTICDHQRGISVWANRVKVFQKKWDLLVTRTGFLETFPFLNELGTVYRELPGTANEFGSIIIISNTK